jgi:hypothetical protein
MEENKPNNNTEEEKTQSHEEQLNNRSTDEAIASAVETFSEAEQPITINLSNEALAKEDIKLQTEKEMEVHHHTHAGHGKKTWKGYFWEFLMLFLAVFCGFLAEYQLEHVIEHQREKQYMRSLLNDLAADTATLHASYPRKEGRIEAIDSVFKFFLNNPDAKTISGKLFRTIRRTNYDARFTRTNITFNQLKNAGGMRLVRNKTVADSILTYDLRCEQGELYYELYNTISQQGARQFEKLFNATDLLPFYIANTSGAIVRNIPDTIIIRVNTAGLNEQLNFMMQEKAYAHQEMDLFRGLQARAERLMELIKKEYHLE